MRRRADFVRDFVLPLVAGGELHVGAPLGRKALESMSVEPVEPDLEEQLAALRHGVAAELVLEPPLTALDDEPLRLAVAVHDLLAVQHPGGTVGISPGDAARVGRGAAALASVAPPADLDVMVARHSLLHLVPSLSRFDTRIAFWAGAREFRGRTPPSRLRAWPSVRRVREDRWEVNCLAESVADARTAPAVTHLLDASPLTDLLSPLRQAPPLDLLARRPLLLDARVARLVVSRWLELGFAKVGPPLFDAVALALAHTGTDRASARFVLALFAHVHVCAALAPSTTAAAVGGEPARASNRSDPLLRDALGLYAALAERAPHIARPADLGDLGDLGEAGGRHDPDALPARIAAWTATCRAACPVDRRLEMEQLIGNAIGEVRLVDLARGDLVTVLQRAMVQSSK